MNLNTVQEIEKNIGESKKILEVRNALKRLESNRDFRLVIANGYLRDESIRLVLLKADPAMQSPASQAAIVKDIDGIGSLASFFRTVEFNGSLAEKAIAAGEAEIEEIRLEGGDE